LNDSQTATEYFDQAAYTLLPRHRTMDKKNRSATVVAALGGKIAVDVDEAKVLESRQL
jgi:hypothetical protein